MNNSFLRPDEVPLPVEGLEQVENAEQVAAQQLEDSTFQPGTYIERSGDFLAAEALQNNLAVVMDNSLILATDIQTLGPSPEIASSPEPQPVPDTAEEISAPPAAQVETHPGPLPSPAEEISAQAAGAAVIGSILEESPGAVLPAAEDLHEADTSQLREAVNVGEILQPAASSETIDHNLRVTEPSTAVGVMVNNTLSGLIEEKAFNQTYQIRKDFAEQPGLYNAAVSILGRGLTLPEVERVVPVEGSETPPSEGEEQEGTAPATGDGQEGAAPAAGEGQRETTPAAGEGQAESTEPAGETGEEWVPPEMYIIRDAAGNITVVDASGKPVSSPPIITTAADGTTYGYYPDIVDKDGKLIKFEIDEYKVTNTDLYYYTDSQGNLIVVDSAGKPLPDQPIIASATGEPPYMVTLPGVYDENGDPLKVILKCFLGPHEDIRVKEVYEEDEEIVVASYINGVRVGYYINGVLHSNSHYSYDPHEIGTIHHEFYCYRDQNGNITAVDASGKPIDSPPMITANPNGNPPYYAFFQGALDGDGEQLVDENGFPLKIPVYAYQGPSQELFYYFDSQGNLTVVDSDGKPIECPPMVKVSPSGEPVYTGSYPNVYDDKGNLVEIKIQQYTGSTEELFYYRDSQGNLTVVDSDGKPIECPPMVKVSPSGEPPYTGYYPEVYDANGNLVKVEIQQYKGSGQELFYYRDAQNNLTVVDASGKPVECPPMVTVSKTGEPPYTACYAGVYDANGKLATFNIQPYRPPSATQAGSQSGTAGTQPSPDDRKTNLE